MNTATLENIVEIAMTIGYLELSRDEDSRDVPNICLELSDKFEELYSNITEGITVEKKNLKEFFIPYKDSPKITISTNYVISDEGNHAKRRQKVLAIPGKCRRHAGPDRRWSSRPPDSGG